MKSIHSHLFAIALVAAACSDPASTTSTTQTVAKAAEPAAATPAAPAKPAHWEESDVVPAEPFTKGQASFNEVRDALLKSYYAEGLTEDDVYRAATAGMLQQLEPRMKKYNKLLSPRENAEIKNDLKGEVVGVGVRIDFDEKSGYADVVGIIPGSAAEKGGLLPGDKIVTVDGKLYKGMKIQDVAADIRGKAGTNVTLSVLRGDKLAPYTLTRDKLAYDQASTTMVGDVGVVRIPSFAEKTPATVKAGLEEIAKKNPKALVIDLRHTPGGSFDSALQTAELLLPEGSPIVSLKKKGAPEETHVSKGKPILGDLPATVLVDEATASGAELLAGALREQRHAKLVGAKTFGKWSVQSLETLPNGYAYKFTLGLFKTPSGKSFEGVGLTPDLEVPMDEVALQKANNAKVDDRLGLDVQLRTATELLAKP
jgi:carboxyl-terminal processing protease